MRLFAAVPLPGAVREALAAAQAPLREAGWPVRWVAPESLHLTLRFFGEVEPGLAEPLGDALASAAAGTGPLPLSPLGIEAWPVGRRARLLWLALDPVPALELLVHRLESAVANLAVAPSEAAFRPHVTLGRLAHGERLPGDAAARVGRLAVPEAFLATEVVLYESRLQGGPPRYLARRSVTL